MQRQWREANRATQNKKQETKKRKQKKKIKRNKNKSIEINFIHTDKNSAVAIRKQLPFRDCTAKRCGMPQCGEQLMHLHIVAAAKGKAVATTTAAIAQR